MKRTIENRLLDEICSGENDTPHGTYSSQQSFSSQLLFRSSNSNWIRDNTTIVV